MWGYGWRPYVPVAQRRARARRYAEKLAKKGRKLQPVEITGRKITTTFWGQAWCDNLERYSDFANRLPRGRTYVRNGSVIDLQIAGGSVTAIVSGSEIYNVRIDVAPLAQPLWNRIKRDCAQSIHSLMDLLEGRFTQGVMERLTRRADGLFPQPKAIKVRCSCPDWAVLCKHAAAVLYGVGARLDSQPELLFLLRKRDHAELVSGAVEDANLDAVLGPHGAASLSGEDLSELFGIDLEATPSSARPAQTPTAARSRRRSRASAKPRGKQGEGAPEGTVPIAEPASGKGSKTKANVKKRARPKGGAKSSSAASRRTKKSKGKRSSAPPRRRPNSQAQKQ